jgi:hypothetical protein
MGCVTLSEKQASVSFTASDPEISFSDSQAEIALSALYPSISFEQVCQEWSIQSMR